MKLRHLLLSLMGCTDIVQGQEPEGHEFIAPGPGASRAPCPVLNALANHGFLPRDGMSITREDLETGFSDAMNFEPGSLEDAVAGALTTGSNGDGTFNLADTVMHDVLEHDGSLSRQDLALGDNLGFDSDIWNHVLEFFTEDTISIETSAAARVSRIAAAKAVNAAFNLTGTSEVLSFAESSLYQLLFGDRVNGGANTQFVKVIFEEERIPYAEGYVKAEAPIVAAELEAMIAKLQAATINIGA